RLAVSRDHQDQGLGGQLLLSAGERCLAAASEVGGVVLLIDAMNDAVVRWYEEFGALSLLDCPLQLVLPLATIAATLRAIER
ncbi:MAG: GNAT family N-acetyltransferase, partial [Gammaproteobacteria bacterium]